jgi:hypothetical protein
MPTTYAIPDGRTVMAATLYTGTGAALSVSNAVNGVSFQPDFVWLKARSNAQNHTLYDAVRGTTKYLISNATTAETTNAQTLTSFNADGFSLGNAFPNDSGYTYVAWQWKANGAGVSNTDGSITSTVSANTTAGFSVVTYTGTGANATVGHGLGVAPAMVIVKGRSNARTWAVYNKNFTSAAYYIGLETTNQQLVDTTMFNSTAPTSSVFSVGTYNSASANTYVAYCWAEVAGFSKFGSYTGNGSTDGPFVYTGFRPRYIMMKRTDGTGDWWMYDTSRSASNTASLVLYANSSAAEISDSNVDILSNGFKLRSATFQPNTSGGTFIYAAFAENPFKYANAR